MKNIYTICTFLLLGNVCFGQSLDNIKFYVLYDVSGSTDLIDRKNHLRELLFKTLDLSSNPLEKAPSFEILFFGSNTDVNKIATTGFDWSIIPKSQYKQEAKRIIEEIKNNYENKTNKAKTHINTVLEKIDKSSESIPCVLIYTDGRLITEDIDTEKYDYLEYVKGVQSAIQELESESIPTFVIQSSPSAGTVFNKTQDIVIPDSLTTYMNERLFWINSSKTINKDDIEAFDFYLGKILDEIIKINQPSLDLSQKDELIETMVYLNFIIDEKDSIFHKMNIDQYLTSDQIETLDSLSNAFKKNSLSYNETRIVKNQIDQLKANVETLKRIFIDFNKDLEVERKSLNSSIINLETNQPLNLPDINKTDFQSYEKAIIKGLSDYIIKRSKKEAIYFLFEDINQKSLLSSSYVRDTLFKNTFNFLKDLNTQPDLLIIKEAFNKDIDELHANLLKYPKIYESEALIALVYSFELIDNLINTGQLEKAFVDLKKVGGEGKYNSYVEKGILMISFLIESIEKYDLPRLYLDNNHSRLNTLSKELIAYFSEMYPDFNDLNIEDIEGHVENVFREYLSIKSQIEELKSIPLPSSDFIEYQTFKHELVLNIANRSTTLLMSGIELVYLFRKNNQNERELIEVVSRAGDYANSAIESWFYMKRKEYVKAVMTLLPTINRVIQTNPNFSNLSDLYFNQIEAALNNNNLGKLNVSLKENEMKSLKEKLNTTDFKKLVQSLNDRQLSDSTYSQALNSNNYGEVTSLITLNGSRAKIDSTHLTHAITFLGDFEKNGKRFKKLDFENYSFPAQFGLGFIDFPELNRNFTNMIKIGAELSSVEEANDITNILTKYALPTASYRLKRDRKWSIMINAYAGVGGSYYMDSEEFNPVISSPIGIEFSKGLNRKRSSASILLAPVDIGNVLNYQIIGDQDEDDAFKFENIYSPGIFFVYGFSRKVPFSSGIGHQWNDNRWTIFFSFDLPLLKLY